MGFAALLPSQVADVGWVGHERPIDFYNFAFKNPLIRSHAWLAQSRL